MQPENLKAIEALIQLSLELMNATQGAYLVADDASSSLRFAAVAVRHGTAESLLKVSEKLLDGVVAYGEGVTGKAASTRSVQVAMRTRGDDLSHVRGDGTPNAVLAVPVIGGDRLLGVLTAVCFDRELSFSSEALRQYQLAAIVAAAILK